MEVLPDGRLRLDAEVELPDPLDLLIVGGGPAGTGAAFRAKELGLSALVVEIDDILKRIRDYDRAKPIKPDFGAGKRMGFPEGGDLVAGLHFFSDVRGEDLCAAWKTLYGRGSVPAQVGVELVGLEAGDGDVWRARVRNHRAGGGGVLRAKHVVLALGAGMPRRLDVPGDVRAIATGLSDAGRHVGGPACVIGGGVSAAEAVIAISEAKRAAGDAAPVYWSYHRRKMPQVPQALEASMTRALSAGGNVRLLLGSEAREVAEAEGGAVLRLRVDPGADGGDGVPGVSGAASPGAGVAGAGGGPHQPDSPVERMPGSPDAGGGPPDPRVLPARGPAPPGAGGGSPLMEFAASQVVACIGQEIDWALLNDVGVFPVTGGAQLRKAIPLNALLESRQPNVYLAGDTLNPSYFECDDFDGDVSGFRKVAHRGNIKAALIDGVRAAEAIAQRLAGRAAINVDVACVGAAEPAPRPAGGRRPAALTALLDGAVEAEQFALHADRPTTIGRRGGDVRFPDDARMADPHAVVEPAGDGYRLRDGGSADGVFLHLAEGRERAVAPGTVARLGRQWLVFGTPDNPRLLAHHGPDGRLVRRYELSEGPQIIGRGSPDITLAADDGTLSRRHASAVVVGPGVFLRDLNSRNGIYVKVDGSCALAEGDVLRVGHQVLRFQFLDAEPGFEPRTVDAATLLGRRPAPPPGAASTEVTFKDRGAPCPFRAGQTLCEVAEAHGVELSADCHAGVCGSDPVRIVSGGDALNPMSGEERATLEELCGVDPGTHRLACMARPTGPVVVEIVEG